MDRYKPIKRDMNYSVAFRVVAADEHPYHNTQNTFRKVLLKVNIIYG